MRRATSTLITVAFLVLTSALPARAAPPPAEALPSQVESTAQLVTGVFATTVQLSVYGSCLVLGGDHSACIESADKAGRRAAGRSQDA